MFQGPGNPALPQSRTQTHQCQADLPVGEGKKAGKDKKTGENRKAREDKKAGKDKKAEENRKAEKDKKTENGKAGEDKKTRENGKARENRKHNTAPWPDGTDNRSAILSVTLHTNHYQTGIGVDQVFSPGRARINLHNNK
ncbi:hypothetical protein [Candidatus Thiosymbion oneisti]|uniref:hypothetical protein n=1 Tax=Candidatus Thiosymbion oneisti TaxID=589554 RepID=UPI001FB09A92|nr:hypothetical protein [Candidatus Thiosymbion oneisti]